MLTASADCPAPASPAIVGEATLEPGSQPRPSASAALAAAAAGSAAEAALAAAAVGAVPTTTGGTAPAVATSTGIGTASGGGGDGNPAAGVGPKSTSPLSIKWPPKQPGQGVASGRNAEEGHPVACKLAVESPAGRGSVA